MSIPRATLRRQRSYDSYLGGCEGSISSFGSEWTEEENRRRVQEPTIIEDRLDSFILLLFIYLIKLKLFIYFREQGATAQVLVYMPQQKVRIININKIDNINLIINRR